MAVLKFITVLCYFVVASERQTLELGSALLPSINKMYNYCHRRGCMRLLPLRFRPLDNRCLLRLTEKSPADLRKRGGGARNGRSPLPRSLCPGGGMLPASSAKTWKKKREH